MENLRSTQDVLNEYAARVDEKRRARRLANAAPELAAQLRRCAAALSAMDDALCDLPYGGDDEEGGAALKESSEAQIAAQALIARIESDLAPAPAPNHLADTLKHIDCNIAAFARQCKEVEYTDTDEAWSLFNRIRSWCRGALRKGEG